MRKLPLLKCPVCGGDRVLNKNFGRATFQKTCSRSCASILQHRNSAKQREYRRKKKLASRELLI